MGRIPYAGRCTSTPDNPGVKPNNISIHIINCLRSAS